MTTILHYGPVSVEKNVVGKPPQREARRMPLNKTALYFIAIIFALNAGFAQQSIPTPQITTPDKATCVTKNPLGFTQFDLTRKAGDTPQDTSLVALRVTITSFAMEPEQAKGSAIVAVQFIGQEKLQGHNPATFSEKLGSSPTGHVFNNLVLHEEPNGYAIVITPYWNLKEAGFEAFVVDLSSRTSVDPGIPVAGDVTMSCARFIARPSSH